MQVSTSVLAILCGKNSETRTLVQHPLAGDTSRGVDRTQGDTRGPSMAPRGIAIAAIVAAVFVSGARCGSPEELAALSKALRNHTDTGSNLLTEARSVKGLSGLSNEERALQSRLLTQTDGRLLLAATTAMDEAASTAGRLTKDQAKATSTAVIAAPVQPTFAQDLEEVTADVVKEQACQLILDQVAPAPKEPGKGKSWTDLPTEVVNRMVTKRWAQPANQWDEYVKWGQYVSGVTDDASQVVTALLADDSRIELFARPPVQRAALAYARFCYPVPRSI